MEEIYLIIAGILVVCILIVLVIRFLSPREAYRPRLNEVVDKLVNEISPKFKNREFTRKDLSESLGEDVDVEMYYNFKKLLNAGKLTTRNLLASF